MFLLSSMFVIDWEFDADLPFSLQKGRVFLILLIVQYFDEDLPKIREMFVCN